MTKNQSNITHVSVSEPIKQRQLSSPNLHTVLPCHMKLANMRIKMKGVGILEDGEQQNI